MGTKIQKKCYNVAITRPFYKAGIMQVFHARPSNSDGMLSWLGLAQEGAFLPPRDVVVEQQWAHREPSGVFTIRFRSVEHPDAPAPNRQSWTDYLYNWRSPVRAQVLLYALK